MRIRLSAFVLALVASAAVAAGARADGLPVLGVDVGSEGVANQGASVRYVTLPAGDRTLLARVAQDGGRVLGFRAVRGNLTIPAVAYDGSAAGLSADGRTLVLVRPRVRFPQAQTTFAVVAAERLRLRRLITLRGDFSFDAISPDGKWLYLVQYVSPNDPTRYLVRLYDHSSGRLLPKPIIDPREVGDVMRGSPLSRATSPDGRWAYTLYDGVPDHPFVHALDTQGRSARCIDLHALAGHRNLGDLRLRSGDEGATLAVLEGSRPLAVIDTKTFRVETPRETAKPAAGVATPSPPDRAGVSRLTAAVSGLGLLALLAVVYLARRRTWRLPGARGSLPSD